MIALHSSIMLAVIAQVGGDQVPYVPRPGGPVDTSPYMWAGYAVAFIVYGGYIALLLRRLARVRKGSGSAP
jgi:hypothetical protein